MLTLSVLDQSPIPRGSSPDQALARTVELAQATERWGYRRYWLAEHHATGGLAGSAPEVMIAHVAAHTSSIRVGSGGVMLSHQSPLKVAEQFKVLHALHPGRIDLGFGRAPGGDQLTALALQRNRHHPATDDFAIQLAELVAWMGGGFPDDHPFLAVPATPVTPGAPELWMLSSSGATAVAAARLGVGFSFANFIAPKAGPASMDLYREEFRPGPATFDAPAGSIAVAVVCGETETEADRQARSTDLWRLRIRRGERIPFPSVADAEAYPYSPEEHRHVAKDRGRLVVGTPSAAVDELEELAAAHGVSEVVVLTITHDPAARLRSYELLAEEVATRAARAARATRRTRDVSEVREPGAFAGAADLDG